MLYEVITVIWNAPLTIVFGSYYPTLLISSIDIKSANVITSYSIHYTKLYEIKFTTAYKFLF